jgi:hypothetical protein
MAAPRTKRQFAGAASDPAQRQITSFFERKATSSTDSSSPSDYTSGPLSPPLPGPVQANLLSVGMRVRKSVPEGYKTGHKSGVFSLWADNNNNASPSPQSSPSGNPQQPAVSAPAGPPLSSARELLPFCGINKVGGLAVQPETPPIPASFFTPSALEKPAISISPAPELDDLPALTSSQDSVTSSSSTSSSDLPYLQPYTSSPVGKNNANSKKRLYTEDNTATLPLPVPDDSPIIWRQRSDWVDGQVSPRSLAPVGWEKNARVMAVPRGVRKAGRGTDDGGVRLRDLDQENRVAVAGDADDFGEAEFLDYMEVED